MSVTAETVALLRADLEAIRNRGVVVAGYFTPGAPKWTAAMAVPNRAAIALARLDTPAPPAGTQVTPGNVDQVLADARPGDRLLFTPGTYRLPTITGKAQLELVGGPGVVCAAGEGGYSLAVRNCDALVFRGFRFRDAVGASSAAVYGMGGANRVTLDACEIGPTPRQGVYTERDTNGWLIRSCHIHDCYTGDDPNRIHGIYLNGTGHVVDGGVVERCEAFGVQVYPWARDVTVRGVTFRRMGKSGVIVGQDVQGTLVSGCRFEGPMVYAVDSYRLAAGGNNRVVGCTADWAQAFTARPGLAYEGNTAA